LLLQDWPNACAQFVKIVPPEYRRALLAMDELAMAEAEEEAEPITEAAE
jgi:glutamate synthase domain-containing protein 3